MRGLRTMPAVLCALCLVIGRLAAPAHAQSIRLKFWATPSTPSSPGYYAPGTQRGGPRNSIDSTIPGNIVWDSAILNFEFRSKPRSGWLWSLSYDTGSITSLVDTEGGFGTAPGTNRFFAASLHRVFTPTIVPGSEVTVFAGYGYGGLEVTLPGLGSRNFDARGLRYGVDFHVPIRSVWYVTGFAAYGRWSVSHRFAGISTPPEGVASVRDYGAAAGRWLTPMAAVEVGWRALYWETGTVGGTACPCGMSWDGFYGALNLRLR